MKIYALLLAVLLALPAATFAADEPPKDVEYSLDPFDLRGPTFRFWGGELHLGGRLAVEAVQYGSDNVRDDGVETEDARLTAEGAFDRFSFRVEPDLLGIGTTTHLWEAWGEYSFFPELRVRAGRFRIALTSDYGTRGELLPYVGYDFVSYLCGRHDTGIMVDGDLLGGRIWYAATGTLGAGFGLTGERLTSSMLSLRFHSEPFGGEDSCFPACLRGFYLGTGHALLSDFDDPIRLETPLGNKVFSTNDLDGDSGRWTAFEVGFVWGPVRIGYEHLLGTADGVPIEGGEEDMDDLLAFGWQAAWNVTGEKHTWSRGGWAVPDPKTRSEWAAGFPGRLELAASWSNADVDGRLIENGLTPEGVGSQETTVIQVMLSWFPNERTRIGIGWVHTKAQEELSSIGGTNQLRAFGGSDTDSSFVLRIEHVF